MRSWREISKAHCNTFRHYYTFPPTGSPLSLPPRPPPPSLLRILPFPPTPILFFFFFKKKKEKKEKKEKKKNLLHLWLVNNVFINKLIKVCCEWCWVDLQKQICSHWSCRILRGPTFAYGAQAVTISNSIVSSLYSLLCHFVWSLSFFSYTSGIPVQSLQHK